MKNRIRERDGMKALKIGGWLLLACSVSHCLTGIVSGEFRYPSMRAFWLTVVSAVCLLLSILMFIVLAVKKKKGK